MKTWKVIHAKDGVETVYLVSAETRREAETAVLDMLYERNHPVDPPYTAEELERDTFGLKTYVARHGLEWTNYALCKMHDCSVSACVFTAEAPYKLYALNTKTGEVT